jgi:hypothetical protein
MYLRIIVTFKQTIHALNTFWLIRGMWGVTIATIITLITLDALLIPFPLSPWVIMMVQIALLFFTYLICFLTGEWNPHTLHWQVDAMISLLLIALLCLVALAYYRIIAWGETGITPYLAPLCIAFAILLATSISYHLDRKNERLSH